VMIVAGTVTHKMAPRVKRLWDQMADPKWVIAMGACTVGGGPYFKFGYHVVKGVDKVVPVDIYLPGCPPRPEALLEAIMRLQELVESRSKRLNGKDPGYPPPEKGSRQAKKDGLSPAEPWQTEKAHKFDDVKRKTEEDEARAKAEAAAKKKAASAEAPAAKAAAPAAAAEGAPGAAPPKPPAAERPARPPKPPQTDKPEKPAEGGDAPKPEGSA